MHHSRLAAFVIDCKSEDVDTAAAFWSAALGRALVPASGVDPTWSDDPTDPYRALASRAEEPMVLVQKVAHESRVHLDIETDDLAREIDLGRSPEVARLEGLGAKKIGFVRRWWVMEAPTGQRFCVVNPQRGALDGSSANRWEP